MPQTQAIAQVKKLLQALQVTMHANNLSLQFTYQQKKLNCLLIREQSEIANATHFNFPYDVFVRRPDLLAAAVQSQLQLNTRVFARTCSVQKISKPEAESFLNAHHLLGVAGSVSQYGLFKNEELLAVATFSNGRKMRRLPDHLRSFELIRFCNKSGVTVSGGLTKLVQHFIREKNPGDIMTYVDAGYSSGESYLKAGFEKKDRSKGANYLVDMQSYERLPFDAEKANNKKRYYIYKHQGNLKLVYTVIANN
jgi:hypothetical protein